MPVIKNARNPKKEEEIASGVLGGLNTFQDETLIKSSELTEAKNVTLAVDGLEPRKGTINYKDDGGEGQMLGGIGYYNSDGTREFLRIGDDGELKKYVSDTPTQIGADTWDTASRVNFVQARDDVYIFNGSINKTKGDDIFPMTVEGQTGWINKTGIGFYLNEVSMIAVEGYITSGTTINIGLYKDFASTSFQELKIVGTEIQYQDNVPYFSVLGGDTTGIEPLGAASVIGDQEEDGRRHFIIFLPFQMTQVEYISAGVSSSGLAQNWEITALAINTENTNFESQNKIKNN